MPTAIKNKFIPCGKPDIGRNEEQAVLSVLRSGWLGYGKVSQTLENEFASFLNTRNAVAVNSATMGLVLALRAYGIGSGDSVITTPLTFAATVNAILMVGAKPIFIDVNQYGSLDSSQIAQACTNKTKAVIPVHLWGVPCDMELINVVSKHLGLVVIEDASHGFGGSYEGKHLGTLGDVGVFSFYPTKNLASCDGGMVVTDNSKKANLIRVLSSQGLSLGSWARSVNDKDYKVEFDGYKGQMNDVSAAIALEQLRRWGVLKHSRGEIFKIYEQAFGKKEPGHSQHIYEIRVDNRTEFRKRLFEDGIGTGIHYSPLHLEPAYKFLGYVSGDLPMAEKIGAETLTLPLSPTMEEEDAIRVVESVNKIREELNAIS